MKNAMLKWQSYLPLLCFVLAGLAIGSYLWIVGAIEIRWAAFAVAIALIAVGLGMQGLLLAKYTADRIGEINQALIRLEGLQNDISVAQQQQTTTNTPIVASMTAISQLVEFFSKQKGEDSERNEKS